MSQQTQHSQSARLRTLHGFGHEPESPLIGGEPGESRFVPIGPRVGRSGQVFETDGGTGRGGLVVKLLTWGADRPEEVVRDFTGEVTTVASLHHPHVVQVVDVGTLGDGTPFVVMERLAGMTLEEAMSGRRLPMTDVSPILRGVAAALSAAHAAGIAHGDVRADNVFMAEIARSGRACPKLLDFGVARLAARSRRELGGRAAERADQLALATLARRLLGDMKTAAIERVLDRAMSPDPSQRFGTVAAFAAALEDAIVGATPASTRSAAATTMHVGAAVPVASRHSVPAVSPPSSLTQQFFAEGDQLDGMARAARQTGARTAVDDEEDEDELENAAVAGVPRSRAQMILAALLALGSVAVIAWTVVSLASKGEGGSQVGERPAAVVRAPALPTPPAQVPARTIERGPRKAVLGGNRALRARSRPAAAAENPTLTAAAAPSSSDGSALAPPPPPPPPPAPPALVAPTAEGAAQASDPAPPDVAPAAPGEGVQAQPDDHAQGESNEPNDPPPSVPDETAPAP